VATAHRLRVPDGWRVTDVDAHKDRPPRVTELESDTIQEDGAEEDTPDGPPKSVKNA
jgi:hypothetical protein